MRFVPYLIASLLLHVFVLVQRSPASDVPTLALSMQPKQLSLTLRPKQRQVLAPTPEEPPVEVKPPEPPKPKPRPKKVAKKKSPPKKKLEPLPPPPQQQQSYVSDAPLKPRMVERTEYLSNPPPRYPKQARRRKLQGTVTVLVDVDERGVATKIVIQSSSGHKILDREAERAVRNWRFVPAKRDGRAVVSKVLVPVEFKLTR